MRIFCRIYCFSLQIPFLSFSILLYNPEECTRLGSSLVFWLGVQLCPWSEDEKVGQSVNDVHFSIFIPSGCLRLTELVHWRIQFLLYLCVQVIIPTPCSFKSKSSSDSFGPSGLTRCPTPWLSFWVSLNPVDTFVNSSFIKFSSYSIWLCFLSVSSMDGDCCKKLLQ